MASTVTYVTCLYDLTEYRVPPTSERNAEYYLGHAKDYLLTVDLPLCVYTSADLAPRIQGIRDALGLGGLTRVTVRELAELPMFQEKDLLAAYERVKRHYISIGKWWTVKFIPQYIWLVLSKFDFLAQVCAENPFGTTGVAWVDFGINHRAKVAERERSVAVLRELQRHLKPKLAFPVFTTKDIPEPDLLNGWISCCAGGLITVPVAAKGQLDKLTSHAVAKIRQGYLPYDETLLYAAFKDGTVDCAPYLTSACYDKLILDYIRTSQVT